MIFDNARLPRQQGSMDETASPTNDSARDDWFTIFRPDGGCVPILVAAPHGGRTYPPALLTEMRKPEFAKMRLEDRHADTLAIEVASQIPASLIYAKVPRAMIDLNRSSEDVDWTMVAGDEEREVRHSLVNRRSRSGLGLVPRRLSGLGEIWKGRLPREELDRRIDRIHRPYHLAIAEILADIRDRWGAALLIDIHSMPPLPKRHADDRPAEFVIGDRFGASCDPMISSRALDYLARHERHVAHNRPYSGGFVLDAHGAPMRRIHALQIEVCRSSYLDARLVDPSARLPAVAKLLAGLLRDLSDVILELGESRIPPIAAE